MFHLFEFEAFLNLHMSLLCLHEDSTNISQRPLAAPASRDGCWIWPPGFAPCLETDGGNNDVAIGQLSARHRVQVGRGQTVLESCHMLKFYSMGM